jgi:hypothetical protein
MSERDDEFPLSSTVIHEQQRTAVYINTRGQVVIRQDDYYYGDMYVIVSVEHVPGLVAAIESAAKSPQAGFRPLEDEPEIDLEPVAERVGDLPQSGSVIDWPDRRELIIAALTTGGKSNRHIARELGCGEATVRRIRQTLAAPPAAPPHKPTAPPAPHDASDAPIAHLFSTEKQGAA